MQILLIYLFLFLAGCLIGWVIEVFFRRFFSAKKWVNPGFMKGPWLPLYGFGVILMFTMSYLCISFMPESLVFYNPLGGLFGRVSVSGPTVADLIPIALMWVGMVLLEFVAGLIFIKGFHVKLWDYTNMKGNILGIICPVFTVIWGVVAVLYYYGVNPFIYRIATKMHDFMFGGNGEVAHFGFVFALGLVYGLMVYDFVTSVGLFASISKFARESGVVARAEELRKSFSDTRKLAKDKVFNSLPEALRNEIIDLQNKPHKENELKKKINEAILIDPNKKKDTGSNYDASGRPIKEEDNSHESDN